MVNGWLEYVICAFAAGVTGCDATNVLPSEPVTLDGWAGLPFPHAASIMMASALTTVEILKAFGFMNLLGSRKKSMNTFCVTRRRRREKPRVAKYSELRKESRDKGWEACQRL